MSDISKSIEQRVRERARKRLKNELHTSFMPAFSALRTAADADPTFYEKAKEEMKAIKERIYELMAGEAEDIAVDRFVEVVFSAEDKQ